MKKIYLFALACLSFLMVGITPAAQAQLNAGELAVVYYTGLNLGGANAGDSVTIINLVPLTAGEQFILTDQSVIDNPSEAFETGSDAATGHAAIYTTPAGGLPLYSLITYVRTAPSPEWADYKSVYPTSPIMGSGAIDFDDFSGDQVFLFRDANSANATEPAAEPVFIFGIQYSPAGWTTPVSNGVVGQTSAEPAALSAAGASLEITASDLGYDCHAQGVYSGPTNFSSQANALSEITNISNWTTATGLFGKTPAINDGSSDLHNGPNPFQPSGPSAVCANLTVQLNASGNGSIAASDLNGGTSGGTTPYSFAASQTSFSCSDIGINIITLTVTDNAAESSSCTSSVNITDVTPPTAVCQNQTVLIGSGGSAGVTAAMVDGGSIDACSGSGTALSRIVNPSSFSCSQLGQQTVTLTVNDAPGNSATCTATVTVEDYNPPNASCSPIQVPLNAGGTASITPGDINNGSSSVCGTFAMSVSPNNFTCNNLGANEVILTVTNNGNGFSASCTTTVTVTDPVAPNAVCKNLPVSLDGTGNASIIASDLDGGSTDNCGIATYNASQTTFGCSDVGNVSVGLDVIDASGNVGNCTATVTVQDNTTPTAVCANFTTNILITTTAIINANDIDGGSSSVCNSVTLSASPSVFDCNDLGANTVTLTATDTGNGNQHTCTATVTVQDPNAYCCTGPIANCNSVTVQLDVNGNGSLSAAAVGAGSTADCGLASETVNPAAFSCNEVGVQTATYTITDINGASASCTASVSIQDNVPPNAICQNATVVLDANTGTASIMPSDVNNGSNDNCGIASMTVAQNTFNCDDAPAVTVTLTVTDDNGNTADCTATVTVDDSEARPPMLAQQGCGNCGQIRVTICQFDPAPDLQVYVMGNANYEAGATLNWYADNSGGVGSPLPGAPTIDNTQSGTKWYWVEQEKVNCPSPPIRVRVRVKPQFAPEFNLPTIGCGNSGGQIDLAAWVSDPKNKTTLYTFYNVDPVANPGATPIGSATATNGVVDFGQYVIVNVVLGTQTYWVQNTVPNGCGSTASSTLIANVVNATLNFIPNITVNSGDPVNVSFSGTNATHIIWLDHISFNNPNIGIMGAIGIGGLSFTAFNPTANPLTAMIRVIAYNGNCAGQVQDFYITVNPGPPTRQAQNQLQLFASMINSHDVLLSWDITSDQELIRFEVEKKRNDGEFEAIGFQKWTGNGSYTYTDESGMGNANQYRLKLVYADGRVVWTNPVKVNMDFVDNQRFDLFPNPTDGKFHVKALFEMEASYSWQLSDVMGKSLMKGEMEGQQTSIQIDALAPGIYHLVMISPEGKRYLMKLVKQ